MIHAVIRIVVIILFQIQINNSNITTQRTKQEVSLVRDSVYRKNRGWSSSDAL